MLYTTYEPGVAEGAGEAVAIVMIFYLIMMIVSSVYSILSYVLSCLGTYSVANRRGINHAWLAWLPVGTSWIMGSISDQYQQVAKNKNKKKRVALLVMELVMYATVFIFMGSVVAMLVSIGINGDMMSDQLAMEMMGVMGGMILGELVLFGVAIAYTVTYYFALYDFYASCRPDNAVLYLVLSILLSFVTPFLIFSCRNKDQGMVPPPQPQYYPPMYGQQPTWQSVQNQPVQPTYQPQPYQPQQPGYQPPMPPAEPWEQRPEQ